MRAAGRHRKAPVVGTMRLGKSRIDFGGSWIHQAVFSAFTNKLLVSAAHSTRCGSAGAIVRIAIDPYSC